jgi:ABC-2 type transport system ATP-binding protein
MSYSAEPPIRTAGLTKVFGTTPAVDSLTLEVQPGEVFGFLGPNGAGKTTTMRVLVDLIRPTAGEARLFGLSPRHDGSQLRQWIGYLPGELGLYDYLTAGEFLTLLADLRGGRGTNTIGPLAERFDLDLGRRIHELSRGNKQKVGLVQAFMHNPKLLLLDEPTNGLDPIAQREFLLLVRGAADRGAAVFLSSHMLSEVERIADRVGVIAQGRLLLVDEIAALKQRATREFELEFSGPPPVELLRSLPGVTGILRHGSRVHCRVRGQVGDLVRAAAERGLVNLISREPDLEDIFVDLVQPGARLEAS